MRRWVAVGLIAASVAAVACRPSASGDIPVLAPPQPAGQIIQAAAPEPTALTSTSDPPPFVPDTIPEVRGATPAPWAAAPVASGVPAPDITAIAAVIVDEASGAILYAKDAYRPLPPASTTKIVTAILALEHGNLDAEVISEVDASLMGRSSVMGLRPGDTFTLRALLYGLMLPSGNDAALAIGRHISGSDAAFVAEMNALLYRFGMDTSHVANPHGLGARDHLVSARDLAMLARYAMTLPGYRGILATYSYRADGSRTINLISANSFMFSYAGADSAKIGYTRSAGNTLVASATRNGHRLYVVVLNTQARDVEAARLLDWAFANHAWPAPQ